MTNLCMSNEKIFVKVMELNLSKFPVKTALFLSINISIDFTTICKFLNEVITNLDLTLI